MPDHSDLRIGVLGPLMATRDGAVLALPRGRAAVMLAVLAVSAGHSVSVPRLARLIWAEDQPVRIRASMQTLAARLRAALPGVIVTTSDGYVLDLDPEHVDLLQFRRLVRAAAQASDASAAFGSLDQALGLWRGEPLADLRSATLERELLPALTDELVSAAQQRAELDLVAGRHARVIAELRGLTAEYPLREPLWEQLLRALLGAGRPAEAIGEYHRAREILATELGVDPSPELQDLYQQLLHINQRPPAVPGTQMQDRKAHQMTGDAAHADGGPSVARRLLPTDTRVFTGRVTELARVVELAEAANGSARTGAVLISAIDGMAGVGKTALAVHAAHRLAGQFSDGQLFIDLHGYTKGYSARSAGQALETLLRALGVSAPRIPQDVEERAALYRDRLAGTRTLIVLDNAVDEAQVRPLIPGSGGCLVIITSRRKLKALDEAHTVALNVLPEADAIALLRAVAGPGRVAADPVAAEIVGLCGRLPLAVRIAASLLRNRPTWDIGHFTDKFRAARTGLHTLVDGDRNMSAVFDLSSQALREDQRGLYFCLGLIPCPETDAYAAAALMDIDPLAAEQVLQDLVDHNLLQEPAPGRYRMHDLIRAHARALTLPAPSGDAALGRLLDYYQHTAARADARVSRYPQPGSDGPFPAHAPALLHADVARSWLRTERANLTACLRQAIRDGDDGRVVALSAGLAGVLRSDGPWTQAICLHTAAAAAAGRLGDRSARARALTHLGDLQRLTDDYADADRDLQAALELFRETGDVLGQARVMTELGALRRLTDDYAGADRDLRAAMQLWQVTGNESGRAHALTELGICGIACGNYREAERHLQEALKAWRKTGDGPGEAHALTYIAEVERVTGNYEGAIRNTTAALALNEEAGDRLGQANALVNLGNVMRLTGNYEGAVQHHQTALEIYKDLGDQLGQANARAFLGEIRGLNGDYEGAALELEESIRFYRDIDNRGNLAWALNHYAAVLGAADNLTRANLVYGEALGLAREVGHPDEEAVALEGVGETHLRDGNLHDGVVYLWQALEIYQRLGLPAVKQITTRLAEIGATVRVTPPRSKSPGQSALHLLIVAVTMHSRRLLSRYRQLLEPRLGFRAFRWLS